MFMVGSKRLREVLKSWRSEENLDSIVEEKLIIQKNQGRYVGISSVYDYIYRPKIFESKTLYEWIQMSTKFKIKKSQYLTHSDDELDCLDTQDQLDIDYNNIQNNEDVQQCC